jgi:hypothetical protein
MDGFYLKGCTAQKYGTLETGSESPEKGSQHEGDSSKVQVCQWQQVTSGKWLLRECFADLQNWWLVLQKLDKGRGLTQWAGSENKIIKPNVVLFFFLQNGTIKQK